MILEDKTPSFESGPELSSSSLLFPSPFRDAVARPPRLLVFRGTPKNFWERVKESEKLVDYKNQRANEQTNKQTRERKKERERNIRNANNLSDVLG